MKLKISPILRRIASIYQGKVPKTVVEATKRRINRDTLSLITNIGDDMRDQIGGLLREGEEQGRSVAATASRLLTTGLDKGVFKSARRRAYLIARTELHRARQRAAVDIYKAAGIKMVKWVGIGDGRICANCKAMNGRTFNLEDMEDRLPPLHPRCRCRLLPANYELKIIPKRDGVTEMKISPVPDDYKYVIRVKRLGKSLRSFEKSKMDIAKAKRVFVPAGVGHKAYYRTDPREKQEKEVLYHGTYEQFERFLPPDEVPEEVYNPAQHAIGIYTSDSKEFAETFGDRVVKVVKPRKTLDLTNAKTFDDFVALFPIDKEENFNRLVLRNMKADSAWGDDEIGMQYKLIEDLDAKFQVVKKLKEQGYDSLRFKEEHRGKKANTTVIFDPEKAEVVKAVRLGLEKSKRVYVPAGAGHKAYSRLDPRSKEPTKEVQGVAELLKPYGQKKLVKKFFKVTDAGGGKVYIEAYSKWDATQRAKNELKLTTVDAEEVRDFEIPTGKDVKFIRLGEEGVKRLGELAKAKRDDYSCVMAAIEPDVASRVRNLLGRIDPLDLHEKNKEEGLLEPHITILYGLHIEIPDEARETLRGTEMPLEASIVGVQVLRPDDRDYDVLVLGISSPAIEELNDRLSELPNTNSFKFFYPHITIAYLNRDQGDKYKTMTTGLEGDSIKINVVEFSDKDHNRTGIAIAKASSRVRLHQRKTSHGISTVKEHQRKYEALKGSPAETIENHFDKQNPEIKLAYEVAGAIDRLGGRALFVGGSVRDALLGQKAKDLDVEVYNVNKYDLQAVLERFGKVDAVGKSFGVFKLSTPNVAALDVSIPRRESKVGAGHKGFMVDSDPTMTVKEAARRRDLTINSMAYDPIKKQLIDEYNGLQDLKDHRLRATSKDTFPEDSLRVLRVMRFAAQLGFLPDEELVGICRKIDLSDLPKERVMDEFKGLLLKSKMPSIGLRLMPILGIDKLPEVDELQDVLQEPCLIDPRAPIFSEDGWKPIGQIKEGDKVLTHNVRFKKVTKLFRTPNQFPKIVTIRARVNQTKFKIALTDGHPVLTSSGNWVFSKDLKVGQRIKMLGYVCECGKPIPLTQENCVSCRQRKNSDKGWKNPIHKEIISLKARNQSEKQFLEGKHPFQNPNNIYKIAKGLSKSSKGSYLEKILEKGMRDKEICFEKQWVVKSERRTKPTRFNPTGIPIRYILDFAVPGLKIGIECDGERFHRDLKHEELENFGWTVLHFKGSELLTGLETCISKIRRVIANHSGEYKLLDAVVVGVSNWSSHKIGKKKNQLKPFTTYNLEVEEDESYIAAGFAIHNCWHPEGDSFEHTMQVVDAAAGMRDSLSNPKDRLVFMLGALLHDIGKPKTTLMRNGKLTTYDHDEVGAGMVRGVLERFTDETDIVEGTEALVRYHMRPTFLYNGKAPDPAIRRLAKKVSIPMVVMVSMADKMGRGNRAPDLAAEKWLLDRYAELGLANPKALDPVVKGRHLILLGVTPGPGMGATLNKIYEAQLDGKFKTVEEGLDYARKEGWIGRQEIVEKSFNALKKTIGVRLVLDRTKALQVINRLRKSKVINYAPRRDLVKSIDAGFERGDTILLKSGAIAHVSAIGRDGLTCRDAFGNKYQVWYRDAQKRL